MTARLPRPPQDKIDRMLADGTVGIISSTALLAAAVGVLRGTPVEQIDVQCANDEASPEELEAMRGAVRHAYQMLAGAPKRELAALILLCREHLRQAGVMVVEGDRSRAS